jgi:hypothetical protein
MPTRGQTRNEREQALDDAKIVGKYIIRKGGKATREFAADMKIPRKALTQGLSDRIETHGRKPKRQIIPKSIEIGGTNFTKYCGYDGDLDSAKEAAEDMNEMGYKTRIMKFQRGSIPVYVLYRYKKGKRSGAGSPTPKKRRVARR